MSIVNSRDCQSVLGPRARRGISSVLVLVAIPSLVLIGWLGVEIGLAVRALHQAHRAADAAALAAAARFADGFETANADALAAAQACRGPNGAVSIQVVNAPGGGGDVEFGQWDAQARRFTPDPQGGPAARVTVRFASDNANGAPGLLLWRLFDMGPVSFTRSSVAVYTPPKHTTSLLLQGQGAAALDVDSSATLASRGGVSMASSDQIAVSVRGTIRPGAVLRVPVLRVAGSVDELARGAVSGSIEEGASIPEDPLANTDLPGIDSGASGDLTSSAAGITRVAPGAHEHLVATAGTLILEAGVHQFTQGVSLSGNAVIQLENAAIELAAGARVSITGSASVTGTALVSGDWDGVWLMQRGGTPAWSIGGGATVDVRGGLYGPDAGVSMAGQASVRTGVGVLGTLRLADDAVLQLDDRIESLDLPVVPGRARLVR